MKEKHSTSERLGRVYERALLRKIKKDGGAFLIDDQGSLHVLLGGQRIPINFDRENHRLAELVLATCGVTTLSVAAQAAIQRLQVEGRRMAGRIRLKRFSALSEDGKRLYVPVRDGQLLRITAERIVFVPNGSNEDRIWLEHPYGEPIQYHPEVDVKRALEVFERLLVETQGCRVPEMRWFVAMHAGLFPYLRESSPARLLPQLIGPTQQGKTSGAQRFTLLHGLGQVKGDYSVAALGNTGDIGLLVMDNKEQANFSQPLIDFCLFLCTGAERGRSTVEGNLRPRELGRPVGMITTIEGVHKAELQSRCVDVQYGVPGPRLQRSPIEKEISDRRHEISSALVHVLQHSMTMESSPQVGDCPVPEFEEHYLLLVSLLAAYGDIAGKDPEWWRSQVSVWQSTLMNGEPDENELEYPIRRVLTDGDDPRITSEAINYRGKKGTLYVTECGPLLSMLQGLNLGECRLPKTPQGLSRRLHSAKFQAFTLLDEESAPEISKLRRKAHTRPVGFFISNDE